MFPFLDDVDLKRALDRFAQSTLARIPFGRYQFVDVTFATPNQDTDIAHTLAPNDPEAVRFVPVSLTAAAVLYRDNSAGKRPWQPTHIWLRASAACTVRLLLFLEPL